MSTEATSRTPRRRRGVLGRGPQRLAAILSIAVLAISGGAWAGFSTVTGSIKREPVFDGLKDRPDPNAGSAINVLLVGSDSREGLTKAELRQLRVGSLETAAGRRSDTMILAHISKERDQATLVSIPRDSYVDVPEWTDEDGKVHAASAMKINATFAYGGPQLTIRTIESMTGLRIDHYVEVNFVGFMRIVDALGGVPLCTEKAIDDPKSHLVLPAGDHVFDGVTAVKYVRSRYFDPTGDLGRMNRQQKFVGAMLRKATSSGVLFNPVRLVSFINAALSTVTTDPGLNRDVLVTMATQLRNLDPARVNFVTVPLSDVYYNANGVTAAVLWHPRLSKQLWNKLRVDAPLVKKVEVPDVLPDQIKVQVLNGTGTVGLASTASNALKDSGFVIAKEPANGQPTEVTTVVYDPTREKAVATLKLALPDAKFTAVEGHGAIFTVTIGSDFTSVKPVTIKQPEDPFKSQTAEKGVCN
jgi:LCP family protein required for cell wall assembly